MILTSKRVHLWIDAMSATYAALHDISMIAQEAMWERCHQAGDAEEVIIKGCRQQTGVAVKQNKLLQERYVPCAKCPRM